MVSDYPKDPLTPEDAQKLYMDLVETSQDLIWQCDSKGRYIYLNPAWEETLEYPVEEMIGRLFSDFQSPEIAKRDIEAFSRVLHGGTIKGYETIYLSKSGQEVHLVFNAKFVRDETGVLIGTRGTAYDITERKRTEEALRQSEFFFKESQRAALIGSYQSEFYPNDIWKTSEVCDEIFGMDENYDKTVKGWTELLHPDSAQEMIRYVTEDVIGQGIPFNKEYKIIRHKDGETRWVLGLGETIKDETGRTTGLIGTIQDITERKKAEDALAEKNQFITSLVNLSPDILYIYDLVEQKNVYSNNRIQRILGYSTAEVLAMGPQLIPQLMHPEDFEKYKKTILPRYTNATDNEQISNIYRMRHKNGDWRFLESIEIIYSRNADNTPKQIFGVARDITEEKQAKEALVKTNARHSAMIANIGDVIGIMGADGIMKYKSPNIEKWFGWKPTDLVGMSGWQTVHPEDFNDVKKEFDIILKNENAQTTIDYRYKCKDGTYTWVELTALNCINNPTINGILLNYRDITERKQAEEALILSESQYKSLFYNLNSSFSLYKVIWNEQGEPCDYRILAVNPMYEKTAGIKGTQLVGKTLLEAFPHTESEWLETMNSIAASGSPFSTENYAPEVDRWIEITVYVPIKGQLAMIATDVTTRKKTELALAAEKERLAVTLRSIGDGVITTDADGKITLLNKAAEKMTGWKLQQAIGHGLRDVFHLIDEQTGKQCKNLVEEVIATGSTVELPNQTCLIAKDGRQIVTASSGAPIRTKDRNIIGAVLVFRDMTEERNAQIEREELTEQLHQSQKMEAIGQLAGGIAHDFNNALGGIIGAADVLQNASCDKAQQQRYLNLIINAAGRAGDLTKKLLLFSRKGNKASTTIDMAKIVNDTTSLLGHTIDKNISISIQNNATQTGIVGDKSLLQNALMNIAINASHAMPDGGKIEFTLNNTMLDEKYCEVSPFKIEPKEYLEIIISDSGRGMSPEIQSHIFEPFFTTKELEKGTGLGLATVYGTIQDHCGAITVDSTLGIGTKFYLYLPVTKLVPKTSRPPEVIYGSGNILLVDDEELIRIAASSMLETLGYNVICAENGQIGVDLFKNKHESIDLVILDMIMPVMGGRETFARIRKIDPNIPVIISSGFAKDSEIAKLKTQGVSGFLDKPFRQVQMAKMVEDLILNKNQTE